MAVPDFQTLMLPALELVDGNSPRSAAEVRAELTARFKLSPDELAQMLPSGKQSTFVNRVFLQRREHALPIAVTAGEKAALLAQNLNVRPIEVLV